MISDSISPEKQNISKTEATHLLTHLDIIKGNNVSMCNRPFDLFAGKCFSECKQRKWKWVFLCWPMKTWRRKPPIGVHTDGEAFYTERVVWTISHCRKENENKQSANAVSICIVNFTMETKRIWNLSWFDASNLQTILMQIPTFHSFCTTLHTTHLLSWIV